MSQVSQSERIELHANPTGIFLSGGLIGLCGLATICGGRVLLGSLGIAFGIVALLLASWMSFSPRCHLRLSPDGFSFGTLQRVCSYRWTDVSGFFTTKFTTGRRVGFAFASHFRQEPPIRWMSPPFYGRFLPNEYGMDATELVKLLESWRLRHANAA